MNDKRSLIRWVAKVTILKITTTITLSLFFLQIEI